VIATFCWDQAAEPKSPQFARYRETNVFGHLVRAYHNSERKRGFQRLNFFLAFLALFGIIFFTAFLAF
jgi:hypothetical protein